MSAPENYIQERQVETLIVLRHGMFSKVTSRLT